MLLKKKLFSLLIFFPVLNAFAQQPPVNDTLIPKQHRDDTVQYEPKLKGGALIDTINTKENKFYRRPAHQPDSVYRKDSTLKPKRK